MKNNSLMTALAVAIFMGGTFQVTAHDQAGQAQKGPRAGFEQMDTDGDGRITAAELDAVRQARFEAMDTDGDGKLSAAEMQARMEQRAGKRVERMMTRADQDGDGALSMAEMQKMQDMRRGSMMERLDKDGDGGITRSEFEAARADMRDRMKRHGGGHRAGHEHMFDN